MKELIGISIGHEEQITPNNPQYSVFFDLLRVFDWRTEPVNKELTIEVLSQFKNILIGEPHREFSTNEIESIQKWIKGGNNLLLIASCSGDAAPSGDRNSKSNLSQLLEIVKLSDNSLGIDKGVTLGREFDTKVIVNISQLVGVSAKLCYDTGCTFKLASDSFIQVENELYAPANSSFVTGVRLSNGMVTSCLNPFPQHAKDLILLRYRMGSGNVTLLGSSFAFKDDTIIRESNILFFNWLIVKSFNSIIENYIDEYEEKPQRHRLLHGYPFPNLMQPIHEDKQLQNILDGLSVSKDKPLIIGVLPHTFCNPMVKGCGFCTFPHESYHKSDLTVTVQNVSHEIESFSSKYEYFQHSKVQALYFGGGTANLTPMNLFEELCNNLYKTFNCNEAEITFEGVPKYFSLENYKYLDILHSIFNSGKLRLSIGIQTFDEQMLIKMGRQNFGDKNGIKLLSEESRKRGIGISGDLLFNLPGQTIEMMKSDIRNLNDLGFNQISIYHLVMFRALGPEWSKDKSILAALPDNSTALINWLTLRELLLSLGYEQRTLTNFQKKSNHTFEYEECVFQPESFNWIGFGPSAISVFYDENFDRAVKLINKETANEYNKHKGITWDKYFTFDKLDMKVLFITRKIALLSIDTNMYNKLFDTNIEHDFAEEIQYLSTKGFINILKDEIQITPKGMFFADTVAGVFSLRKIKYNRMMNLVKGKTPDPEEYFYSVDYNNGAKNRMG